MSVRLKKIKNFFFYISLVGMTSGCNKEQSTDVTYLRNDFNEQTSYALIQSLVNENTGLVSSTENEPYTTVYKNALAAMAFILNGEKPKAEKIFDFFKSKYVATDFQGFTQSWNPETGEIVGSENYWEGDVSFLLLALNYYKQETGSYGNYQEMANGIANWLAQRGNEHDDIIIAEGLIDMYAALKPWESSLPQTPDVLLKLHSAFLKNAAYPMVGDHIERAALTLGITDGFDYIDNFKKQDIWQYNTTNIHALSAFSTESFINTEISAQNLLAWSIWKDQLTCDLSYLEGELYKMRLNGTVTSTSGLPYLTQDANNSIMYNKPIIDPTCYMLFYFKTFNPMAPGKKCLTINYDFIDCENIISQTGNGVKEYHDDAIGNETFQITQSNSSETNHLEYQIQLHRVYTNPKISIRYSDDVAGNLIKVNLDGIFLGEFTTLDTGGWNDFLWNDSILSGNLNAGNHQIELICSGGSYGVNLDVIKISE